MKHIANARALTIWFYSETTSPNGDDEINTTSDGNVQLSLLGHPVFIRPVNFAFLSKVKFHMVNAHWNILQMHVHLQYDYIVKKHHKMDMMKSTQRVMERNNYHCPAIPSSSGQSILHFCRIFEHVKFLTSFGPQKKSLCTI